MIITVSSKFDIIYITGRNVSGKAVVHACHILSEKSFPGSSAENVP
jgi:hypothetical protein